MFYDLWPGTTIMCDCLKHNGKVLNRACKKGGRSSDPASCERINPVAPQVQAMFYGYRVCGSRGGDTFLDVKRGTSLQVGGVCPAGY